jgi:hypothetical protein
MPNAPEEEEESMLPGYSQDPYEGIELWWKTLNKFKNMEECTSTRWKKRIIK